MNFTITDYMVVHGVATVGAVLTHLLRTERRLTKLETLLKVLHQEHILITAPERARHQFRVNLDDDPEL